MPTYEYACKSCGQHLEVVQSFTDEPLTTCPSCAGALRKVFGNIGISFKGTGFYKNDSRSSTRSGSAGSSRRRLFGRLFFLRIVLVRWGRRGQGACVQGRHQDQGRPCAEGSAVVVEGFGRGGPVVEASRGRLLTCPVTGTAGARIAVIGGSGLYSYLDVFRTVRVETPYGPPSAPITIGEIEGRRVAFLPRHGVHHEWPPHRVNYRANLWALREVGAERVIGPCAVGSLRSDRHPGDLVVPDQLVDRTSGRPDTFIEGPVVDHVSFADPYCPELSGLLASTAAAAGQRVHRGGTVVVISGPRFSTRAESAWYRQAGWDVINMTQYPEAYLARELGLCYAALASVTDYDTGVEGDGSVAAVTHDSVLEVLAASAAATRAVLSAFIPRLADHAGCACASSGAPSLRRR